MQTAKTVLIVLLLVLSLAACGNKGPLYLPAEDSTSKAATGQESAGKDETVKEEKQSKKDDGKGS